MQARTLMVAVLALVLAACGGSADENENDVALTGDVVAGATARAHTAYFTLGYREGDATPPTVPELDDDDRFDDPVGSATMSMGTLAPLDLEGAIDFDEHRGFTRAVVETDGDPVDYETRFIDDAVYTSSAGFANIGLPAFEHYDWIRYESNTDNTATGFLGNAFDPFAVLEDLDELDATIDSDGTETIDGVTTTAYRVRFDRDRRATDLRMEPDELDDDSLDGRLWIDEQQRLRRLITFEYGSEIQLDFSRFGEPVEVEEPTGDRVYDTADDPAFSSEPDYANLGDFSEIASGSDESTTWSVWRADAGDGWACWTLESDPEMDASGGFIHGGGSEPMEDFDPQHNGYSATCDHEPNESPFGTPLMILAHQTVDEQSVFVGVGIDGLDNATITFDDGTTETATLDDGVIAWFGPSEPTITKMEATRAGRGTVLCEPMSFPEGMPGLELVGAAPLTCFVAS